MFLYYQGTCVIHSVEPVTEDLKESLNVLTYVEQLTYRRIMSFQHPPFKDFGETPDLFHLQTYGSVFAVLFCFFVFFSFEGGYRRQWKEEGK